MPMRHDIRTVTVPGCVDGWIALHERYGRLDLATILAPAIRLAAGRVPGQPAPRRLAGLLDDAGRTRLHELADQATMTRRPVRRPGVALTLQAIVAGGRDGGVLRRCVRRGPARARRGLFSEATSAGAGRVGRRRCAPTCSASTCATIGPNSQGYLTLGRRRLAEAPACRRIRTIRLWAHVLIEAATAAAYDRPDVLHEGADGGGPRAARRPRRAARHRRGAGRVRRPPGDTTYLCTADASGWR